MSMFSIPNRKHTHLRTIPTDRCGELCFTLPIQALCMPTTTAFFGHVPIEIASESVHSTCGRCMKEARTTTTHLLGLALISEEADLQRVRAELDQETLNRIDYQNQVQTLLEEIDFIRRSHDQEIKDLQAMAARDTTSENREFFRNELASAIRDIRNEYDVLNNKDRNDIESWYKLKVQEIETQSARQNMEQGYQKDELKRLRVQLTDLRGKLSDLEARMTEADIRQWAIEGLISDHQIDH